MRALVEIIEFAPRRAERFELERVHHPRHVERLASLATLGGGALDPDTYLVRRSLDAALRARRGRGSMRSRNSTPARPTRRSWCCARRDITRVRDVRRVSASSTTWPSPRLASSTGANALLIVDYDAHHGNGTQEIFDQSGEVFYVSLHQHPAYPGTGSPQDLGAGPGLGSTLNVPFPRKTEGDAYRLAFDELLIPAAESFSPTWCLVSAGFDADHDDPLTDLGLTSGDFADLTASLCRLAAPGRRVAFLEGGYDLLALQRSVGACPRGTRRCDVPARACFVRGK